MKVSSTTLSGVLLLEPEVYGDSRGFFFESFNERRFAVEAGIVAHFVQDNHSRSGRHILRGLHYQVGNPQGKLIRVVRGAIFDVAVDLRRSSPTFGHWDGVRLDAEHHQQLWVPPGLAHGFLVLSDEADVLYKTTDYWSPQNERCIRWDDPQLAIAWPLEGAPVLSDKDRAGQAFADAELFP
ncbi:dTDP-4-dehydrorhamnose 3,5-epimerase [Oryzomicrobium terrae]|uniref:dTDP-4-dehydrorhamnose 3,5-epimerase n=1 Tax=Oryzomicrobium terrae TaxID=1735038 RepID=A0A5C1EB92_9RHOO|nr:dTDP-4-dehydrorhamnose 3,5-epimerase [Oryzomicrobium terrae]QEL66271.1 dTDP-4-dehydrorhamnose 3,5-epimerase [Oryzomicrobium terrae]